MENLATKIAPQLHINMTFAQDTPKKCRSCNNSPTTNLDLPTQGFPWLENRQNDMTPTLKPTAEPADLAQHNKLKGLEEMGCFSEFTNSKPMNNYNEPEEGRRRSTLHITDFMQTNNKKRILRNAGGFDAYLTKRKEYQKELILKEVNLKKFFQPSEKKPEFFNTPPISPRYLPSGKTSKEDHGAKNFHLIDSIIEKCDEAMKIKPPKYMTKSNSPRLLDSEISRSSKKLNLELSRVKQYHN